MRDAVAIEQERWRKRHGQDPKTYTCRNPLCGIRYKRKPGRSGRQGKKYCSRQCKAVHTKLKGITCRRVLNPA